MIFQCPCCALDREPFRAAVSGPLISEPQEWREEGDPSRGELRLKGAGPGPCEPRGLFSIAQTPTQDPLACLHSLQVTHLNREWGIR